MKRKDKLTVEQIAKIMCDHFATTIEENVKELYDVDIQGCDVCPFSDKCGKGQNGIDVWLNQEVDK